MDVWSFRKSFFFSPDMLRSSQQLLSNPDDCGALPTSNWHRFGSAQTWGYLWQHSHFIFSLSLSSSSSCVCLCALQTRAPWRACHSLRPNSSLSSPSPGQICVFFLTPGHGFRPSHPSSTLAPLYGIVLLDIWPRWLTTSEPPSKDKEGRWENTTSLSFLSFINCACVLPLSASRLLGREGSFTLRRIRMGKI